MADFDYYGADYGVEEPSRFLEAARNFGVVNWAGALTSIGLTAGLAVWAVDLTLRDVSAVPVIRALEGPMRVAPENPGGTVAPFQGLALSDITSGGAAAPAPDQIVLAPPPVALDAPALAERAVISEAAAKASAEAAAEDAATLQLASLDGAAPLPAAEPAVDVAIGGGEEEASVLEAAFTVPEALPGEPAGEALDTSEAIRAALSESLPGIARSTRPRQRPAGLRRALAAPATIPTDAPASAPGVEVASIEPIAAIAPAARDIDPATIAPGTRVVQLGAFDSEAVARAEWDRLEGRFRDYMAGKGRMIQKARSGGRDFWRLRVVGFADGSDARRFCSELLAKDAACIPVTVR